MKITSDMKSAIDQVDYNALYLKFCEKYRNVFTFHIDDEIFIYRALGRQEYREILDDDRFDQYRKEELICDQCLLYPEDYDWDNCPAGVPTALKKNILEKSYLDDLERRHSLHNFYRSEMYDLDNQITCIINEAFPQFDIESIEQWDVEKTTKYLSRAEWKLHNLRGLEYREPEGEFNGDNRQEDTEEAAPAAAEEQTQSKKDKDKTIRGGSRKEKLTPDKMKERAEFLKKFPEFANDDAMNAGVEGLAQETVDVVAPALRPGF